MGHPIVLLALMVHLGRADGGKVVCSVRKKIKKNELVEIIDDPIGDPMTEEEISRMQDWWEENKHRIPHVIDPTWYQDD